MGVSEELCSEIRQIIFDHLENEYQSFGTDGIKITIENSRLSNDDFILNISLNDYGIRELIGFFEIEDDHLKYAVQDIVDMFVRGYRQYMTAKIRKENKIVTKVNYNPGPAARPLRTPADYMDEDVIERDKQIELINAERQTKIAEINANYDRMIHDIVAEYYVAREKTGAEERARAWHVQYQALIDQGFSEEQAMKLTQDIML